MLRKRSTLIERYDVLEQLRKFTYFGPLFFLNLMKDLEVCDDLNFLKELSEPKRLGSEPPKTCRTASEVAINPDVEARNSFYTENPYQESDTSNSNEYYLMILINTDEELEGQISKIFAKEMNEEINGGRIY